MPRVESLYFNDNDKGAVRWLNNAFPDAVVDPRSVVNVKGTQLNAYDRVHLFAGIGGWQLALDLAGWPRGRSVWTGSCPCQPFSTTGSRTAFADARHLWPEMYRLVGECRPATIFGEQVASGLGVKWFARVRSDLEAIGYAVGYADLPAACLGAPHPRQRLWWVAHAGRREGRAGQGEAVSQQPPADRRRSGLGHAPGQGLQGTHDHRQVPERVYGDAVQSGCWQETEIIECADGQRRRIEPGIEPVAYGVPDRMVKLRGYGNAIVPQLAAVFIRCFLETEGGQRAES